MLSSIVRSTTRQRARVLLQDAGWVVPRASGGPSGTDAARDPQLPEPAWPCGMLAGPAAFSLRRSDGPAKCEESAVQSDKGQDAKAKSSPVATVFKVSAALFCWGLFAGLWFASITLPAALVWAASTGRWKAGR
ncbi:unnamed protein product [Symbiodinium sp. KB8]|nr:unnamed protein product [Symbiodinium sp. KB8]